MDFDDKIFVAGHRGMVGSAIFRALTKAGYQNVITRTRQELPLDNSNEVESFFAVERPKYVFLAAAKVGGIQANKLYGGDFIRENLQIEVNIIDAAYRHGVEKFLFLGSSCIYPKFAEQPIQETSLLTGELEETNLPYAVAKIAGTVMCDAYREQFGFNAFTVMPPNVYGIGDNFHPENSHVVAGLMQRFHKAKVNCLPEVVAWGTGSPLRELIYCDDLAEGCIYLMQNYDDGGMINVGTSDEYTIRQITELVADVVGYEGKIAWDKSKPDGTPRKIMNNEKISQLGWKAKTEFRTGLEMMYAWYMQECEVG
ncbi:GDP-L-fucose synthase family protein [Maritalea porphyrae]|uniref:GDP-L-fucose synthase n=1 Tax=Maritalea porphyrae TaxID=880732 RepID=A0ABQ5UWC3_9HYPH|nr:GDP-L-fucose synthase [Maritalea porphyrae]GLQ18650.1 GDP-L-fucose synthase [Maritalea porphyrae]